MSFDGRLDYHECPFCGCGQLIEAAGDDPRYDQSEHGFDRACVACGAAVFLDPMLIWPGADRAETA